MAHPPPSLRTECLVSSLHPELLAGGVADLQWQQHGLTLVEVHGKCQFGVDRGRNVCMSFRLCRAWIRSAPYLHSCVCSVGSGSTRVCGGGGVAPC